MIGRGILGVVIVSLVVQLAILGIAVFWTVEILQTVQQVDDWKCSVVPALAGCPSTPTPTPTDTGGHF
jgi:hypothetical protein